VLKPDCAAAKPSEMYTVTKAHSVACGVLGRICVYRLLLMPAGKKDKSWAHPMTDCQREQQLKKGTRLAASPQRTAKLRRTR